MSISLYWLLRDPTLLLRVLAVQGLYATSSQFVIIIIISVHKASTQHRHLCSNPFRLGSQINQGPDKQLGQLCSCIRNLRMLGSQWICCLPRVCVGTGLFCHGCGLLAGKNCWHRHEWSVNDSDASSYLLQEGTSSVLGGEKYIYREKQKTTVKIDTYHFHSKNFVSQYYRYLQRYFSINILIMLHTIRWNVHIMANKQQIIQQMWTKPTSRLSDMPFAIFAIVLASRGAITIMSAHRRSSICSTGSVRSFHI